MPEQSSAIILSRCDRCGYEASSEFLKRGMCQPCREWRDTAGRQTACYDTKDKSRTVLPAPPKVTRYITVRRALARAQATYGYIPRFIVTIIRQNTKRSGKMESLPLTKLPTKLHDEKTRRLLRLAENKQRSLSRSQGGSAPAP